MLRLLLLLRLPFLVWWLTSHAPTRYAAYYRGRTAEMIDAGLEIAPSRHARALDVRARAQEAVEAVMDRNGVTALITPGATGVAPRGLVSTGDAGMQAVWSLLGWPTLSLPTALLGGLPVGIQLVGLPARDEQLMRVGDSVCRWPRAAMARWGAHGVGTAAY